MILDNVTIIIPAHNRPDRLQRLLDYYEGTGATILVPDSSTLRYKGRYNPHTTTYRHFPNMHFLLKLREVLPLITTPYVLYCADDDFAVPTGIDAVTRFLDEHPDYVVAQGHYLTFTERRSGGIAFRPRYIRYFESKVEGETPVDRLSDPTPQYASFLYGVVRSEVFKEIYTYCFNEKGELRFRNLFLAEDYFCHAMRICGKYATLPCFYSARERIPGSATSTTVPKSVIMTAPEHRDEYLGYLRALTLMLLHRQPQLTTEEAEGIIRSVDIAPIDTTTVTFKRRVMAFCSRHAIFRPLTRFFDYRYAVKGRRAVKGMPSYPYNTLTPEIRDILTALTPRQATS